MKLPLVTLMVVTSLGCGGSTFVPGGGDGGNYWQETDGGMIGPGSEGGEGDGGSTTIIDHPNPPKAPQSLCCVTPNGAKLCPLDGGNGFLCAIGPDGGDVSPCQANLGGICPVGSACLGEGSVWGIAEACPDGG
jgi:hypothetical protein